MSSTLALHRRFPVLTAVPRAALGRFPSPVLPLATGRLREGSVWIKRDDLNCVEGMEGGGGNKVRALEFLLAGARPGDRVLTIGGRGSVHIFATAWHAARLGARTTAIRWPHEMHSVSSAVAREIEQRCEETIDLSSPVTVLIRAAALRFARPARWVPFGGTSPLGMLGHVSAALELAEQVGEGLIPVPSELFVALGSGGTAAGLSLGLAIAGLPTTVVAVRAGPRLGVDETRLRWLAWRCRRLLFRLGAPAGPDSVRLRVDHSAWAGAYGRPLPRAEEVAREVAVAIGGHLDATYSAKACYAALERARTTDAVPTAPVLFWHTFDGRWMKQQATGQIVRPEAS